MPPGGKLCASKTATDLHAAASIVTIALQVGDMLVSIGGVSSGSGTGSLQQVAAVVQVGSGWPAHAGL